MISEVLKSNSTLTKLDLMGEGEYKQWKKIKKTKKHTGNKIGEEGARMINEVLKSNSTLKSLDLSCEGEYEKMKENKKNVM